MTKGFTLVKEACYEQKGGQREQRYLTDLEIEWARRGGERARR